MKKALAVCLAVFLSAGVAFAQPACTGADCYAKGNFDLNTLAIGGGIDADGKLVPNGAAGGISAAGGLTVGQAHGEVSTIKIFKKTFSLGSTEASIDSIGGGITQTHAYNAHPPIGDLSIGVGSASDGYAVTGAKVDTSVIGVALVEACVFGIAGQGTLNGSVMGPSPLPMWDSFGITGGVAGQGSVGAFHGVAGAAGLGSAGFNTQIDMWGQSSSDSYRAIEFNGPAKTEIMGTHVFAATQINSYGYDYDCGLAIGNVDGGWIAGGAVATKTFQVVDGGFASANANGAYFGAGDLNCNYTGSAEGYTQTSATKVQGYNGAIMQSSAGMKVTSKAGNIQN